MVSAASTSSAEKGESTESVLRTSASFESALGGAVTEDGFEYAGAHPKAKKDVLDGIKAFAQGVSRGLKAQSKK